MLCCCITSVWRAPPATQLPLVTLRLLCPAANASRTLQGNYQGQAPFLITPAEGLAKYTTVNYVEGCQNINCDSTSGFGGKLGVGRGWVWLIRRGFAFLV
jgi:hypothetical protein